MLLLDRLHCEFWQVAKLFCIAAFSLTRSAGAVTIPRSVVTSLPTLTFLTSTSSPSVPTSSPDDLFQPNYARDRIVSQNAGVYVLSPTFVTMSVAATRTYDFTLSIATGAPDGVSREMMVINGQFPGPLIEANEGDTIVVNVHNDLKTGAGIHWHGMYQKGSNWADGVPGISQCPIPAGTSFTYEFVVIGQYGTYWYHSHMGNTMADGLLGPLIIHSPADPIVRGVDYDHDIVVLLGDWMHKMSDDIVNALLMPNGYLNATVPDSLLINGAGVFNCSSDLSLACVTQNVPEIHVLPNQKYRMRIINHASHPLFKFSIDDHPLKVVEADDTPVFGPTLHQLPIGNGQRYSIIVDTSVGNDGDAYHIRSVLCTSSLPDIPSAYGTTALAVLRYVSAGSTATTLAPNTRDWSDSTNNDTTCPGLDSGTSLSPIDNSGVPLIVSANTILTTAYGFVTNTASESTVHYFFNSVSWKNYIYKPMLAALQAEDSLDDTAITHAVFNASQSGVDLVVSNADGSIDHPYHLHGMAFYIVATGSGVLTQAKYDALDVSAFNLVDPMRRDTIIIPRNSHAVLRVTTDNPGVWPLHCHIGWHLAIGKMAVIVIQPGEIPNLKSPNTVAALCSSLPPGDTTDTIAPGRRRLVAPGNTATSVSESLASGTKGPIHKGLKRVFSRSSRLLTFLELI